jgi:phospholipid/cholesterol/gamma-HCH transport system substrate-binding protein
VNVGFVNNVEIRTDGLLIVQLRVRKQYKIPMGTTATIEPNGFFGDQLVALHPDKPNTLTYAPGDTLLSGHATPQIGDVLARVDTIAANISVLTSALKKELVEGGGFTELRHAVRSADSFMADLKRVAAEQNAELTKTQMALRKATSAVDSIAIDSTLRSFRGAAANVNKLTADLSDATAKLNATIERATTGNGSLAKFMNDPEMYNQVKALTARIDDLIADFKKNPRKYIKLSIF